MNANRLLATTAGLALSAAVAWLSGCAAGPQERAPELIVAERAQSRIDAMRAGDFEQALTFYSPGYRAVYGVRDIASRYAAVPGWKSAVVDSVSCEATAADAEPTALIVDSCEVTMTIEYTVTREALPMTRPRSERWQLVGGDWYVETP